MPLSLLLIGALALTLAAASPVPASAISRNSVLARGQKWVDSPVPYSQAKHHLGYRTDCSGYVSMCWRTGTSWNTRSFHAVTHKIAKSSLMPGDALLKKGYHIRLFYGWVDDAHTQYVAYEAGTKVAICRIHAIADDLGAGYVPARYDRISNSPKSNNVLKNGSFNVWASSWGSRGDQPVWWQSSGSWQQAVVAHRTDTYRSTHGSLKLMNANTNPAIASELSQSAPIVAGTNYRLSAWAKTDSASSDVELSLTYLNAAGEPIAEISATGDRAPLARSSFRKMTLSLASPVDAVRALVTVRLAGGTTTSTAGAAVAGTSVTLDDMSLTRPRVTIGIKTSAKTAHSRKSIVLRGAVTPVRSIGASATIYMKGPGSAWKRLGVARVSGSSSASWKRTFTFTRAMRRGTYSFKTSLGALPGYLGATSATVSVKLK